MQDKFEDFIDEHRAGFDIYEPPDRVWNAISKQLPTQQKRRRFPVYQAAAALLFIIGGAVFYFMQHGNQQQPPAREVTTVLQPQPEVNEAEHYYAAVVQTNLNELDEYGKDYPDLCKSFKTEIDTLGKMYAELKTEYNNTMGNEAVIQAMVDNLQKQVSLLNQQIAIIRSLKQKRQHKKIKFT